MTENLSRHFNEKGFVIARNLLELAEIERFKQVLLDAIKVRKQLDKRKLSEKTEYEQETPETENLK